MSKTWPIFVATKGRAKVRNTINLLEALDIPYLAVVEPDEERKYRKYISSYLTLSKNNRGLAYVRQWVLDYARECDMNWFWMLDDDITKFYRVEKGKCIVESADKVLLTAQKLFKEAGDSLAQGSLEYQQFGWSAKKSFSLNSYCDVVVAIHAQRVGDVKFRKETDLKVDRDFTLQLLAKGMLTMRACHCCFSAPKNGSNEGGLQKDYEGGWRERQSSLEMVRLWGSKICKLFVKPDGRNDCKINWRLFRVK
jgi:glycosyltransferase involved in cell wall biosynthesis